MYATEALLKARFGPEACISRFGAIWVVHVDLPTEAEIQERLAEVEQDMLEPEDCSCCDLMRPQAGDTIIFDGPMCLIEPAPWRKLFPDLDEGEPDRRSLLPSS
jgi:hypothetical protein